MPTLSEARKTQDDQVELLRQLQWKKAAAAPEVQEAIQKEIDEVQRQISASDSLIRELIKAAH